RRRGCVMPTDEVIVNQHEILANQKSILANQAKLDRVLANQATITANQETILANQSKLDKALANQAAILANQETIQANQHSILARCPRRGSSLLPWSGDSPTFLPSPWGLSGPQGDGLALLDHAVAD